MYRTGTGIEKSGTDISIILQWLYLNEKDSLRNYQISTGTVPVHEVFYFKNTGIKISIPGGKCRKKRERTRYRYQY